MGIFRNFKPIKSKSDESGFYPVVKSDTKVSNSMVFKTTKVVDSYEYGKDLDMPTSEEYSLDLLLKNGNVLNEIPCSGVLNPTDSSDPRVQSELSNMAEQLHSVDENFNIND